MKKIKLLLCCLLLSISLVGCGGEPGNNDYKEINGRLFLVIESEESINNKYWELFVDVETKVQYVKFEGGYQGPMSVLVDADGKPILYEGEVE